MTAKLEFSFFCEAASQNMGKNNFYGVFDRFQAKQFPALHPSCCLVGRLSAEPGKHKLQLKFRRSADGTDYLPAGLAPMEFVATEGRKNDIVMTIAPFPLIAGPNEPFLFVSIDWLVDGELAGSTEFTVAKLD